MVRPTRRIPWVLTLPLFLAPAEPAQAQAPASETAFRAHVAGLVETGVLDYEEGLLARFQRLFAPDQLPDELDSPDAWPARSGTSLILEYEGVRDVLSRAVTHRIDGWLTLRAAARIHETEHFRFEYETSGAHAVAPADVDGNGVPDLVERVGEYAEASWTRLFDELGFTRPVVLQDRYRVLFREMESYGYTVRSEGGTLIVLHRDFQGFPQNRDPDGSVLGAAKVAVAHELKHASQHAASDWTEGGWLEADAMWAEDAVFDATDDYLRYLASGSPVSDPHDWLRNGQASYEDCLFQHLLAETWGSGILVDFFERRALAPTEPVMESFARVLADRGSSLSESARALGIWSYFSGANAFGRPVGFEEADRYPTPPILDRIGHPEETLSHDVLSMGSHYVLVDGRDRSGHPSVSFSGDELTRFAVHAISLDLRGIRRVAPVPLVASKASLHEIDVDWDDLGVLMVTVTNLEAPGSSAGYFLSVDDQQAVGVDPLDGRSFALAPNRPNPFRSETRIAFTIPADGTVRLSIFDVGGRLVRRLVEGARLDAGGHERSWNGLDESGRAAAPGVYYYRLESGDSAATRKMLLLR